MRRAEGAREHLDRAVAPADRDASLADIDRLNAWFGGYSLTLSALDRALDRMPSRRVRVVDVGGGRGDFARRLIRHARRRGRPVHVVVVDRDPDLLRTARLADPSMVSVVRADASALPFREASVDAVTISLTLHHMEPDAAATSLREMHAASRVAVIVNDLWRTRLSLALVWIATRVLACHPISRHDGPLSVRRAYSADELGTLAEKAGIPAPRIKCYPLLGRLLAVIPSGSGEG
jgi:2-polyprenyl-3-methyl-5-hydroxy-6-metoxy-1,4-benzoquinol methylase